MVFKNIKKTAFSLIELLIALIIISIVISAFAPIITRKFTTSSVVLNGGVNNDSKNDNNGGNVSMPSELNSQEVCDKLAPNLLFLTAEQNGGKRACVTKANVGDTFADGPQIVASAGIQVVDIDSTCGYEGDYTAKCCWFVKNNGGNGCSSSGNGDSTYDCHRTVCTWAAAKSACENWAQIIATKGKWRLPTKDELFAWSNNLKVIQKKQGKNGLQLCDMASGYGSVQCNYPVGNTRCDDTDRLGNCGSSNVWSSTLKEDASYKAYYYLLSSGKFIETFGEKTEAKSVRCIMDEDAYKETFGGSSSSNNGNENSSSTLPTDITSQSDCDKIGKNLLFLTATQNGGTAACVTKANVGDSYNNGPDLDKIKSEAGITVVNVNSTTCGSSSDYSSKCCWLGNNVGTTANSCDASGNGNSTYSGCKRTLCNWAAAKAACTAYEPDGSSTKGKWRLPTKNELSVWANNLLNIQKYREKDGLELCDYKYGYGSVSCAGTSGCNGAESNMCYAGMLWSLDENGSSYAYHYYLYSGAFETDYTTKTTSGSVRCVLDAKTYKNGSSGGGSNLPTSLTSQADCDKFGKNLLYLTSSQNGGKAACVTKANVGDSYNNGPDLDKIKSSAGIRVVNAGTVCRSTSLKCCWLGNNVGKTADSCDTSGNGDNTYSGCKRTMCNWAAAKAACENWESVSGTKGKWRLPTKDELAAWGSVNKGKSGLELCDWGSGYGSVFCEPNDSACPGAMYNNCNPYIVWSLDEYSSSFAYTHGLESGTFYSYSSDKTAAYSARCVLDEDAVKSL